MTIMTADQNVILEDGKKYGQESQERIDHDRLFKELLQTFFDEFLQLFLPEVYPHLDLSGMKFLNQEIFNDITKGERKIVDLLVEARLKSTPVDIIIFTENQANRQKEFNERFFVYFTRIYEKYRRPILPIVIFSHAGAKEEENSFEIGFPFKKIVIFQYYRLQLKHMNWRDYIIQDNPVAAALISTMGYEPGEQVAIKKEFLRMLVRLKLDPARTKLLIGFFETYLKLNEEEEKTLKEQINQLDHEEAKAVFQIETSWERKGREKGKAEGKAEGKREKELEIIHNMLSEGFDVSMIAKIAKVSVEEVEKIRQAKGKYD